ncbi:MAG TPA: G1 family glutamic endopeptidase, partial [Frankiaceae bacterium]|nr:G1 family glutamic endopeptidase [Frankiaceae bacterium]
MRAVRRVGFGVAALAAVGFGAAASPAGASAAPHRVGLLKLAAPHTAFNMTQSNNWSGYDQGALEKSTLFTSITGTWTVPTATQNKAGEAESSATWVGIGGGCLETSCAVTDETLIQAGTEQDVDASGKASYYAWYELIPVPSTQVSLPVSPGNEITVSISQTLPAVWAVSIKNVSTGQSWSTTTPYPSTMGSAEWVEETPLEIGTNLGLSSMPKLSTVNFSGATVNGAPANLDSSEAMQLVNGSGQVLATPSNPSPSKTAF